MRTYVCVCESSVYVHACERKISLREKGREGWGEGGTGSGERGRGRDHVCFLFSCVYLRENEKERNFCMVVCD